MELRIERAKLRDYKEVIQEVIDTLQPDTCIEFLTDYINDVEQIKDKFEKLFYGYLERYLMDMVIDYALAINKDKDFRELYKDVLMEGCSSFDDYSISDFIDEIHYYNANDFYPILKQYMQRALNEVIERAVCTQKEEEIRKVKNVLECNYRNIAKYKKNIEELEKEIIDYEEKLKKLLENQ